jgi:hypothetical protein
LCFVVFCVFLKTKTAEHVLTSALGHPKSKVE